MAEKKNTKKKEPAGKPYGVLGKATNPMEEEIAETILPLLTVEDEDRIAKDKLTLSGCMQKCMENGRKYEVRNGNRGIARITEEQHWKWVFDYYGIKGQKPTGSEKAPEPAPVVPEPADDLFGGLLNF